MRKRMMAIVMATAVLAACGSDAGQAGASGDAAVVDSGMAPTPALDSVGGTTNSDPGRSD